MAHAYIQYIKKKQSSMGLLEGFAPTAGPACSLGAMAAKVVIIGLNPARGPKIQSRVA
jgi:hypothetical protein